MTEDDDEIEYEPDEATKAAQALRQKMTREELEADLATKSDEELRAIHADFWGKNYLAATVALEIMRARRELVRSPSWSELMDARVAKLEDEVSRLSLLVAPRDP
jgi:ssRNA-specific RNase YbeY (16S rRNA maturation enzyme)